MLKSAHGTLVLKSLHPDIPANSELLGLEIEATGSSFVLRSHDSTEEPGCYMAITSLLPFLKTFTNVVRWGLASESLLHDQFMLEFESGERVYIDTDEELQALVALDILENATQKLID